MPDLRAGVLNSLLAVGYCFEKPWKIIERKLSHFPAKSLGQNRFSTTLKKLEQWPPLSLCPALWEVLQHRYCETLFKQTPFEELLFNIA
jgi:hypothetical protein